MSRYRKSMAETMAEVERIGQELPEVAPPGWEGTVKAMKKHSEIDNPWALAWHMKKKGYKSHKKEEVSKESKHYGPDSNLAEPSPEDKFDYKPKKGEVVAPGSGSIAKAKKAKASDVNKSIEQQMADARKEDIEFDKEKFVEAEGKLPPHLAKFFDKKGNPKPDAAKRMADGQKKREVKYKTKDVTPKGYGPNEEVEEAYESPLDSPKAKAAREKLKKVLKGIKKKDPDHQREEVEIDELDTKTMDSYAKKASASQADAEKKQDYKTADKRIAGKLRATRRKFSNDTNKILDRLKSNTTTEEMDFKVKLKGLPSFYVPGKSAAAVRMMLRRQVKRPDDIESVDRVTKSSKRKDFRLRGQGKDLSSKDDD